MSHSISRGALNALVFFTAVSVALAVLSALSSVRLASVSSFLWSVDPEASRLTKVAVLTQLLQLCKEICN